jgi:hypothetical protein
MPKTPPRPQPAQQPPEGQPTKRQEMRDAVNQVLQKVADDRQAQSAEKMAELKRAAAKRRRSILLLLLAFIGLAVLVVVMLPVWRNPFPAPAGAAAERDARAAIVFASKVIDTFRSTRGRLPISLEEAGVALPGIAYAPRGVDGYELVAVVEGRPLTFTSDQDRDAFSRGP